MKRKLFTVLLTGMLTISAYGYAPAKEPVDTKDTANAFSLPGWNISPIDPKLDPDLNQVRKGNLLALGAKHKGAISSDVMMAILDVSIPDGGATQKGTILQVVAVPEQLKIWLKVPGLQNWTEIQLKPLFGS